jgi:hypothetical protein
MSTTPNDLPCVLWFTTGTSSRTRCSVQSARVRCYASRSELACSSFTVRLFRSAARGERAAETPIVAVHELGGQTFLVEADEAANSTVCWRSNCRSRRNPGHLGTSRKHAICRGRSSLLQCLAPYGARAYSPRVVACCFALALSHNMFGIVIAGCF